MAGVAAGHNAVKQIHTAVHALNDVAGGANAHQVADLIRRGVRLYRADHIIHHFGRFADSKAADCITVQIIFSNLLHVLNAQVFVGAALIDAKQQLVRVHGLALVLQAGHFRLAAQQPACGTRAAVFGVIIFSGVFHAFIKGHGNGGAKVCLNLHALFRPHKNAVAVQMRVERYAFLGNVAQLGKAEHLKSAAVGQDRAVPAGKLVQAAHIGNDLITGTQVEMIGVAQHDLCADFFQIMCRKPAFDRGSSGNVLESRCLNRAVHSLELAAAGCTLFFNQTVWHK